MVSLTPDAILANAVTAVNLGTLLTGSSLDAVCVLNSDFDQVFVDARPLKVVVREFARLLDHPLENGQVITDYKVQQPIEITLPVMTQGQFYRSIYNEIRTLYQTSELLTVQTRTKNYENMVIAEMPHEQTPEQYDVIRIELRFRQILIVGAQSDYDPEDDDDLDTEILGFQLPSPYTILGTALGIATTAQSIAAQVR